MMPIATTGIAGRPAAEPMPSDPKRALFARHPFFAALSPAEYERVFARAHAKTFARGEAIFAKGDPGQSLLAVASGTVKVGVLSPEGREIVLNLLGEGQVLGEISLLDGRPRSADAAALTACELLILDRRDFLPLLREAPELGLKLMELLCTRLRNTTEQVEDLMFLDLPGRLAKTLLRLCETDPRAAVRLTQRELGEIVGISRERINKQLRAWAGKRWIELEKGGVVVRNPAALARYAID